MTDELNRLVSRKDITNDTDRHSYRRNARQMLVKRSRTVFKGRERRRQELNLRR